MSLRTCEAIKTYVACKSRLTTYLVIFRFDEVEIFSSFGVLSETVMVRAQLGTARCEGSFDALFEIDVVKEVLEALVIGLSERLALVSFRHFNGWPTELVGACVGFSGE